MADNPSIAYKTTAGTGETLLQPATDDIGGVQYQRVKVNHGADGSASDVSAASPLPVDPVASSDVKFASISAASSGDNTIVAAVTSKKIRVLNYTIIADAAVDVRWYSGAGGTALSGLMKFTTGGGASPSSTVGLFETASNTALVLNLSAANGVRGHIAYREV